MCINCYHRRGKTKKAWACPHTDKLHYSKGQCQNCYLAKYYKVSNLSLTSQKRKSSKKDNLKEDLEEPVAKRQCLDPSSESDTAPLRVRIISNDLYEDRERNMIECASQQCIE